MVAGSFFNRLMAQQKWYRYISNLRFIKREATYKVIGLQYIKWLVYRTAWRKVNPKMKLNAKPGLAEFHALEKEMTSAEISHLIGFCLVLAISLIAITKDQKGLAICLFITNILFNLYPALLQQQNKYRIKKILAKYKGN
jgi:cytochrome b561